MSILSEMYVATCELFTVGSPKPAVDQYTTTSSSSASCPKSQHNKGQFGKSFDIFHFCCSDVAAAAALVNMSNANDVNTCVWTRLLMIQRTRTPMTPRGGHPQLPSYWLYLMLSSQAKPTLSYYYIHTQVVDLLMAKWVAIFVKTILI